MENKMTNAKAIDYVLVNFAEELPSDVVEKLTKIKASYDKKSANRKPTKTQEQNKELAAAVAEVLTGSEPMTISEILASDERFAGLSNQKMTAVVRGMVNDGVVIKTADGKKSVFALAEAE